MLPLQITLKNFMSYGAEPTVLDLRDMPIVCLSGDNGHGKSAILDAITWALWGETRMGKQNHEQLIRLGADEMAVVLEFQEGSGVYRVRRQRSRRAGAQLWEVQIREADGAWRPISGQSSGDTARAIVHLLRMNYETFLNSAYLRQGRADEFVRQTANKRKEILAEILDLSRFDDLEARARTHMRASAERATDAVRAIQQAEAAIAEHDTVVAAFAEIETKLAQTAEAVSALRTDEQKLTVLGATLASRRTQIDGARAHVASISQQIARLQADLAKERAAAGAAEKVLAERDRIENDFAKHEAARERLAPLQSDARRFRELDRRKVEIEHRLAAAQREIEIEIAALESQKSQIAQELTGLSALQAHVAEIAELETRYQRLAVEREQKWARDAELANVVADLRADYARSDADVKAQSERLDVIARQGEACSVCGSPLPPDKLERLAEECGAMIEQLELRRAELKAEGTARSAEKKRVGEEIASLQTEIAAIEKRRSEIGGSPAKLIELEALRNAKLPELEQQIASKRQTLSANQFEPETRAELAEILGEHRRLQVSENALSETQAVLNSLTGSVTAHAQLESASRELVASRERATSAQASIDSALAQQTTFNKILADAPELERQILETTRTLSSVRTNLAALSEETVRAQREHGRLQDHLKRIEAMRVDLARHATLHHEAKNEEDLFGMLAGAFGKRGVQALIIENALPELEEDANALLGRLTDDQMSIAIQTTRIGKSKSVDEPIETLDIAIRDNLGDRPLEMYSGGESFRVAFALRIALSKLLTRRAGAELQTLIIDEGFGTQDAKGREKLVDAILAIQGEFAQIIVITHVDELKDAFPNRIEVVKTDAGSQMSASLGAGLG